ncbi:MAG: hypothetical protein J5817_09095, partial [Treponema sp.]|nr:hypothetical protein [Treponema sp.]
MRKRFISVLLSPAAVLIFLLAVSSCSGILSPSEAGSTASSQASREQGLSLRGSFSFANATAAPSAYLTAAESTQQGSRNALPTLTGISYSVKARRSDGTEREATVDQAALTYEFSGTLTAGTWELTAYAKQGETTVMQSDPTPITLSKSVPEASASLALKPSTDGDGSINLTISCATDSGIGFIKTECENETKFRATGSDGSKTLTITNTGIPSGIYEVTLSFYTSYAKYNEGAAPLYKCKEYIAIYPGLQTNKWTPSTAPHIDASGNFKVTLDCVHTFIYRKIYVDSASSSTKQNGTSEQPYKAIESAMARLSEVAGANIVTSISETTPWELHVTGTFTASSIDGNGFIDIPSSLTYLKIVGEGSGATIDANTKGRVLNIPSGANVTLESITLKNG